MSRNTIKTTHTDIYELTSIKTRVFCILHHSNTKKKYADIHYKERRTKEAVSPPSATIVLKNAVISVSKAKPVAEESYPIRSYLVLPLYPNRTISVPAPYL